MDTLLRSTLGAAQLVRHPRVSSANATVCVCARACSVNHARLFTHPTINVRVCLALAGDDDDDDNYFEYILTHYGFSIQKNTRASFTPRAFCRFST